MRPKLYLGLPLQTHFLFMKPKLHLVPPLQTLFLFMRLFFKKANHIIDNSGPISNFKARENPNLIFLLQINI